MYYLVHGELREETAGELRRLLHDGTIARQKPDGQEIVESMERAVVTESGVVEWSEVCYCATPLQHERSTVYDRFFDHLTTEPVEGYQSHVGRPFLEYLDGIAKTVVNEVLRQGLTSGAKPERCPARFTVASARRGFVPGIDPFKLDQLVDDLEVERFLARSVSEPRRT